MPFSLIYPFLYQHSLPFALVYTLTAFAFTMRASAADIALQLLPLTHSYPNVTISGLIVGATDVYKPPSNSRRRVIIESNPICVCLLFLVCLYFIPPHLRLLASVSFPSLLILPGLLDHTHPYSR